MVDTLKNWTISNAGYFVSNSATASVDKAILHAIQIQLLTLVSGMKHLLSPETVFLKKKE